MFIRWARKGIQEGWFELVHLRGIALGMAFIDGTAIRAHKAAGAKRGTRQSAARLS